MKLKAFFALSLSTLLLTSCLDKWYPYPLSGNLNNGIYTNHTRNGRLPSFDTYSVMVPQAYNFYHTPMLTANEIIRPDYTYVSFGPMGSDDTLYRVMIITKRNYSMQVIKDKYFPVFINLADKGSDRQMRLIYQTHTFVNKRPAWYKVYNETKADVYNYISHYQPGYIDITHAVYFVDYGKYVVIFWVSFHSNSGVSQVTKANRSALLQQRFRPLQMFLRSFQIHEYCGRCGN